MYTPFSSLRSPDVAGISYCEMVVPITTTSSLWEGISYSENTIGTQIGRNNSTKLLQYEVKGK
jgi:hypothetical protein